MAATAPRVFVDAQAFQNPWSAERGIGRYLSELIRALGEAERQLRLTLVLNPDLVVPRHIDELAANAQVTFSDRLSPSNGDLLHVPSPFEPTSIDRVWPPALRGVPLVVTVHDLIPFVLSDLYLASPSESRWFKTRLELVRRAHHVIAVSRATADDVAERASVRRERVVVISEAPADRFKPPLDRAAALRATRKALPGLRERYVFYPGGMDRRKNIGRLVEAYAGLPRDVRARHQLVVACHLTSENRADVDSMLDELGVADDVLFPGYVSDATLVLLYQSAELVVFPSVYEGFGLPVAEAMSCGTPVIASRTSSIPELIEDQEALFDPYDPRSIRKKLLRALSEPPFLEHLRAARLAERHSWPEAARQTAEIYASASRRRPRGLQRQARRLAVVAGLPPDPETARETFGLLAALGRRCEIDAFGETTARYLPAGVNAQRLARLDLVERVRGGYDAVLSILGEGPLSLGALSVAKGRGGHVLLGGTLSRLYAHCAGNRPDLEPRSFDEAVRAMYRHRLAPALSALEEIKPSDADRLGLLMSVEVVSNAAAVFVQSAHGRQLVELDADASHASKIEALPVAFPELAPDRGDPRPTVVARLAGGKEEGELLFEALGLVAAAAPELGFVIVAADRWHRLRSSVARLAAGYGISSRVYAAHESDRARWQRKVRSASAAFYLAEGRELAISPFLIESLAAGVPTVSLQVGPVRELPDEALIKLPPDSESELVAQNVLELLGQETPAVSVAAVDHARANPHEQLADRLYKLIFD